LQPAPSPGLGRDKSAFWKELSRAPRQFCENFCDAEQLTLETLAAMSDAEFKLLKGRWKDFRTVPDLRRDSRLSVSERIDYFTIFHNDGTSWEAPRQRLSDGRFRTPDDPTPALAAEPAEDMIQIRSGNFIVSYLPRDAS
jgi:hypothetical protein